MIGKAGTTMQTIFLLDYENRPYFS